MAGARAEFVGGPRDGERLVIAQALHCVRFQVPNGRGNDPIVILYRRRPGQRGINGVIYYDFLPNVAA